MAPLPNDALGKVTGGKGNGTPDPKFDPGDKVRYWDDDEWIDGVVERFYVRYYHYTYTYVIVENDGSVIEVEEWRVEKRK